MLGSVSGPDLRALRVFKTVADCGGFIGAQIALNVSQSTISIQISSLEKRLGFRLCERGHTGFRLTERGRRVAEEYDVLANGMDTFRAEMGFLTGRLMGDLHVGIEDIMISNPKAHMAEAIDHYRRREQEVHLHLDIAGPNELERAVVDDRFHLAIGYFGRRLHILDYDPLFAERQFIYCACAHPLFDRDDATIIDAELENADWVTRGHPMGEDIPFTAHPLHSTATASHMEAVATLILSGHHLGYLPEHYVTPWINDGAMRPLQPDRHSYHVTFNIITRKGRRRRDILARLIDDLHMAHRSGME